MAHYLRFDTRVRVDDGIRESCGGEGPQATVIFKTRFSNRYLTLQDLLGKVSGTPDGGIVREIPFAYPPSRDMFCMEIADVRNYGEPRRDAFGFITYAWSDITAIFRRPPYDFDGSTPWANISVSGSGELITVPRGYKVFENDGLISDTQPSLRISQQQINIKRYRMPFIPAGAMQGLVGGLNDGDFTIMGTTYPVGTLWFTSFDSDWQIDAIGNIMYEIDYHILFRSIDWNRAMHPRLGVGFQFLNNAMGGGPSGRNYPYVNFNNIP